MSEQQAQHGNPEAPAADSHLPAVETPEEALRAEIDTLRDQLLRDQAEMQNVRRRAERDAEAARKFALERFAADLLPVMDNLERALGGAATADAALQPVLEGVELTRRQLEDVLRRHQVEVIDPAGQAFDPQWHEAVASVPAPGAAPNAVLEVMQKGYTLNGRLLRAAMVVVAQG